MLNVPIFQFTYERDMGLTLTFRCCMKTKHQTTSTAYSKSCTVGYNEFLLSQTAFFSLPQLILSLEDGVAIVFEGQSTL